MTYTSAEIEYLAAYAGQRSPKVMASDLRRSRGAVVSKIRKLKTGGELEILKTQAKDGYNGVPVCTSEDKSLEGATRCGHNDGGFCKHTKKWCATARK